MPIDTVSVNGNQLSWGSITCKIDGDVLYGFTDISYADARERVKAYGQGRHHAPRGRSRGKYTVENAKITGWKSSIQALRERLAQRAKPGESYCDVEFQVTVDYFESDELPVTVELRKCVIAKNSTSDSENADPEKEEIELDVMGIARNGLVMFDQSRAQLA